MIFVKELLLEIFRMDVPFDIDDNAGRTPLHTAVWSGHSAVASYLLEHVSVDCNVADQQVRLKL